MTLKQQIQHAKGSIVALEKLYREAKARREEGAFKKAIAACAEGDPDNALLLTWSYRLDIKAIPESYITRDELAEYRKSGIEGRNWWIAVAVSIVLGALFVVFAGNKPPMPIPVEANPLFSIGWGPLTALAIIFFLAITDYRRDRIRWYVIFVPVILLTALLSSWTVWGETGAVANLVTLHLPFVTWAAVGGTVVCGYPDIARQFYGFLVKSVETVLTAGIYLIAAMIFAMLTYGIFAALGIVFSQSLLQRAIAWGFGAIPILALTSVYDASSPPASQNWETGLARILRILTRLFLPLALAVLAVYVFWFIPAYFWRPFREREALIVYNASIIAIISLLICAVPGWKEKLLPKYNRVLRYAMFSTAVLTILLNAYALSAIISRTFTGGITPNRHAVLGWNVVTLLMLTVMAVKLLWSKSDIWTNVIKVSSSRIMMLAITWSLWVLFGLPHF